MLYTSPATKAEMGIDGPETEFIVRSDIGRFSIVPRWVIERVSAGAVELFAVLADLADQDGVADLADNETGQCWPSHAKLAELLGVSTRTVITRINELVDAGAVTSTKRFLLDGSQAENIYTLHNPTA